MEETILKLAASVGGFAGLAYFANVLFLGKKLDALTEEFRKLGERIREATIAQDRHRHVEIYRLINDRHTSKEVKNALKEQLDGLDFDKHGMQ